MGLMKIQNNSCIFERLFINNKQSNIEVINAGCGAYCSWQELIKLNLEIFSLKPNLIINISGWNDMLHSSIGINFQEIGFSIMIVQLRMLRR